MYVDPSNVISILLLHQHQLDSLSLKSSCNCFSAIKIIDVLPAYSSVATYALQLYAPVVEETTES